MGTRLPEKPPDGAFANFCWTTGAFFDPENPPDSIQIQFSGIKKGQLWLTTDPEPPNLIFILPQISTTEWLLSTPEIIVGVAWTSILTQIFMFVGPPVSELTFDQGGGTCVTSLVNSFASPTARHYYDGVGQVLGVF